MPNDVRELFELSESVENRQTGRTAWMVKELCDAIELGQPKARVFAHSFRFIYQNLIPWIRNELFERGLDVRIVSPIKIEAEESVIMFFSLDNIDSSPPSEYCIRPRDVSNEGNRLRGLGKGWGDFVDHLAELEIRNNPRKYKKYEIDFSTTLVEQYSDQVRIVERVSLGRDPFTLLPVRRDHVLGDYASIQSGRV